MVKVIKVQESVFAQNDQEAADLRQRLKQQGTFLLNVMSSPGSGKTTTLTALINLLKDRLNIAVMDVDIETDLDAARLADGTGVPSIQIHNCGLCHIDAGMTREAIEKSQLDTAGLDLLILENIGNLVCPAEFDTGAHKNIMLLSVPEGDDKPLKYPLMFQVCDLILITKIDTLPAFDFDLERCRGYIRALNPRAEILPVSARTGEGMDTLARWVCDTRAAWLKEP